MYYAPIILFVYNRLEHTKKTIYNLLQNPEAKESRIYIFSDGPKDNMDQKKVNQIREYIDAINGFKEKIVFKNEQNEGLAKSIVSGLNKTFEIEKDAIVLEDDILVNDHFLRSMNELLFLHENHTDIMHISASIHHEIDFLENWFFYNVNSCWGWATWKRSWARYVDDPDEILKKLETKNIDQFIYNGGQGTQFYDQLIRNKNKELKTWACKWHATIFIHNGKCIHPKNSLTKNIGFDGSGTNCGSSKIRKESFTQNYLKTGKLNNRNSVSDHIKVSASFAKPKMSITNRIKRHIKNIFKIRFVEKVL